MSLAVDMVVSSLYSIIASDIVFKAFINEDTHTVFEFNIYGIPPINHSLTEKVSTQRVCA